jgi:hypothetical protein
LPVRAIALGSTLMPRALVEHGDWVSIASIARRYVEYAQAWEAASAGAPAPQVTVGRPMMGDTTFVPVPPPLPPTPAFPALPQEPPYAPPTYPAAPAATYVVPPGAFDPAHSAPSHPLAPSRPGQSQPGQVPGQSASASQPGTSQPAHPGTPPLPPTEPPDAFKPWDSKPVPNPKGDDWLR